MAQQSYLVKRQIYFSADTTYVRPGDILVYDEANDGKVSIFRAGTLMGSVRQSITGMKSLLVQEPALIEEIHEEPVVQAPEPKKAEAPKAEPKAEPKPEEKPEETKPVEETKPEEAKTPEPKVLDEGALRNMTKAKLVEYGKTIGLDLDINTKQADLIAAIVEKK